MHKEERGLSETQAKKLLARFGPNSTKPERSSAWAVLARQFTSPFVALLAGAAGITLWLGEIPDCITIGSFVIINGILGFIQEYRSERALRTLSQLTQEVVRVIRDNKERQIPASELVPGDLVLLRLGDIIPADVTFITSDNVQVDESALTGETLPVIKSAKDDQRNKGFSQTSIISGTAVARVTATGKHSRMGEIDELAIHTKHSSAFEESLEKFGRATLRLVVVALIIMSAARLLFFPGQSAGDVLVFAVALAVSVIPEALQLVTTFALSSGALRLAKHHVIVKRLSAIEDLGSIEVLCSDKTGTITRNHMQCDGIYGNEKDVLQAAAFGCSNETGGFDGAIWQKLPRELRKRVKQAKRLHEEPFNPEKRYASMLVQSGKEHIFTLRGAPEAVCAYAKLESKKCKELLAWASNEGKEGRRVIAFAEGTSEHQCEVVGAISFVDPMKPGVPTIIKEAKQLGIAIKIVSGDSPEVTGAIAKRAGIITNENDVITGKDIEKISEKELRKLVKTASVFARISPEQKHRILTALHEQFAVGFLGEGVNDAPALRAAHVGIVVREACDIARASADIILVEPDLEMIIEGVREGRRIFANTIKYVRATITSNFGNFFAIIAASFFIPFLPMTAAQLLFVNLLSDFPMMTIVTDNVDNEEIKRPRGDSLKRMTGIASVLGLVSTGFDLAFFFVFLGGGIATLQTNWFIGSILTELFFLFSIRTARPFFLASRPSKTLTIVSLTAAAITIFLPFSPLAEKLRLVPPTMHDLSIILLLVVGYIITSEIAKALYLSYKRKISHTRELGWT